MKTAQDRRRNLEAAWRRHGRPQTRQEILLQDIAHTLHEMAAHQEAERAGRRFAQEQAQAKARRSWWTRFRNWLKGDSR